MCFRHIPEEDFCIGANTNQTAIRCDKCLVIITVGRKVVICNPVMQSDETNSDLANVEIASIILLLLFPLTIIDRSMLVTAYFDYSRSLEILPAELVLHLHWWNLDNNQY
jgi:hypothetical protein